MKSKGKVINWNDTKGYGFIEPNSGGDHVFAHVSDFKARNRRPVNGDQITCELKHEGNNRYKAININYLLHEKGLYKHKYSNFRGNFGIFFVLVFFISISVAIYLDKLPLIISYVYMIMSFLTFNVYAIDKSAAKNRRWRIKESTLQFLSVCCGWPGGLIAQKLLRHKTIKQDFQLIFKVTIIINIAVLLWLQIYSGEVFLDLLR